jgi:hypothetical protein
MSDTGSMTWEPLQHVGEIKLGARLGSAESRYELIRVPAEERDSVGWIVYRNPNDTLRVYLENGVVASVACYESFEFAGRNLIGMSVDEALGMLGYAPSTSNDIVDMPDGPQHVYDLDSLEVQLWAKDGRVVTVFCGPLCDE